MISLLKVERKGKKVQLTFSNSTTIKVSNDIFNKYNLSPGKTLSDEIIFHLIKENEYFEAKISALRYLSIRNHSYNELHKKLSRKKISDDVIKQVLDELQDSNYLNDRKFAEQFYTELVGKFFGPLKIKNEMLKRGIALKIIEELLVDYFNNDDLQKEVIKKYLTKNKFPGKIRTKNDLQRIYKHLLNRGFSSSVILSVLREKYNSISDEI